jgi:antitoxin Phd
MNDADIHAAAPPTASLETPHGPENVLYETTMLSYNVHMATIPVSDARQRFAEIVDLAQSEPVVLERYGQPAAVVISHERYEQLMDAWDDADDAAAIDAALAEAGSAIPWDQVQIDLGWK